MISVNIRGVARPAGPNILTAKTLAEAVKLAKGEKPEAKKVPVVVVRGNEVKVVSR